MAGARETGAPVRLRAIREGDRPAVARILTRRWGSARIVTRGRVHHADACPGAIAWQGGKIVGLATYEIRAGRCEMVTLDALRRRRGIGTRLLRAVERAACRHGCREVWLVTTNDNLEALRFYQRRGWAMRRVHAGAIIRSRRIKPEIPPVGRSGIPIRDEIELFRQLRRADGGAGDR